MSNQVSMNPVLIMAGGKSSRMRASFGDQHKALVPVLGTPMLERNLTWLLALGFREIYLAIGEGEYPLLEFAQARCLPLVSSFGAHLELLVERIPLGNIGACRLCRTNRDLVVIYVDNLTTIDLHGMLNMHSKSDAAMTIAVHHQTFQMPFGQVILQGQHIVDLVEKPHTDYLVSSGTYVVSNRACRVIPPKTCIGASELFNRLKSCGENVEAFCHSSLWIDVNDSDAVRRAESLVATHSKKFECLWSKPDQERVVVLLINVNGSHILVDSEHDPLMLGMPLPRGAIPELLAQRLAIDACLIATFDEATSDGHITRFHVFLAAESMWRAPERCWLSTHQPSASTIAGFNRCLAYARHRQDSYA